MSMFDSVYVVCPRCAREIECQSKAGDCQFEKYPLAHAPAALVADLQNYRIVCGPPCSTVLKIRVSWFAHAEVAGSSIGPRTFSETDNIDDWKELDR
jgi:hypothetical protein